MSQDHLWQEQIRTGTIISLKNMPTTWSTKQERRKLSISSISAVTFMLSIRQQSTYAFPCFGGQSSVRLKVASKSTHCMMWKHRFLHSFISRKLLCTIQKRWRRSLMNQTLTTYLIELTITLRCCIRSIKWKRRLPKNVLSDQTIELKGFYPKRYYPESLRLVRYWDEEQQREFIFLTNAIHISALQVAELYKNRWQVELFFKWLKQHLKIKKFWGTTESAVLIQIYAAICTYCLVAIVQHDMKLGRSTYEVLQILGISLTDKTNLRDLFSKTKFQNDKERASLNGPNLFNF